MKFKFTLFDRIKYSSFYFIGHKKQVIRYCEHVKTASFNDFLHEYYCSDINWKRNKEYPESHFDYGSNSEVHAGVIQFKGIGMMLKTKLDYKKFQKWEAINSLTNKKLNRWEPLCGKKIK